MAGPGIASLLARFPKDMVLVVVEVAVEEGMVTVAFPVVEAVTKVVVVLALVSGGEVVEVIHDLLAYRRTRRCGCVQRDGYERAAERY